MSHLRQMYGQSCPNGQDRSLVSINDNLPLQVWMKTKEEVISSGNLGFGAGGCDEARAAVGGRRREAPGEGDGL
jgi:hypothetical protein